MHFHSSGRGNGVADSNIPVKAAILTYKKKKKTTLEIV